MRQQAETKQEADRPTCRRQLRSAHTDRDCARHRMAATDMAVAIVLYQESLMVISLFLLPDGSVLDRP